MQINKLSEFIEKNNLPQYRLKQAIKAVYGEAVADFSEITTMPQELREQLGRELRILSFTPLEVLAAKDRRSFKALLELADGRRIETVLISAVAGHWSACVSSQTGCALACRFCATGTAGPGRNLRAEEICDQILFWRQYRRQHKIVGSFSNIVFMGMGEPFLNYGELKKSIISLLDPKLFDFSARHISVSTAGIPAGIKSLAHDFPQLNLAVSLVSAIDEKRSELMPVNRQFNLGQVKLALDHYFTVTKRKVFLEYIMLNGVNDSPEDADKLTEFIRSFGRQDLLHVNLIRYNWSGVNFKPASPAKTRQFKDYLQSNKISATIRQSLGEEISAACGQLAGNVLL